MAGLYNGISGLSGSTGLWLSTTSLWSGVTGLQDGSGFSPLQLFAANEPGGWYDPSDLSTMFQDSAGSTPVTATGQTVGLLLDRSKGLVESANLLGGTWTFSTGATESPTGTLNFPVSGASASQSGITVAGRTYVVRFTATGTGTLNVHVGDPAAGSIDASISTSGTYTFRIAADAVGTSFQLRSAGTGGFVGSVSNISVKELAGNHLTQATLANRPIYGIEPLGGRRNLLTYTEQFDNAAWTKTALNTTGTPPWVNTALAPDGTTTADLLIADGTANQHWIAAPTSISSGVQSTFSIYVKKNSTNYAHVLATLVNAYAQYDLTTGALVFSSAGTATSASSTCTDVGNGYWRITLTVLQSAGSAGLRVYPLANSNNTAGPSEASTASMYVWGAQLETGSTATAYQRVTDQWNVTEAGKPSLSYLQYDGSDDFFVSPTITPGIDKAQVFAGVRKLSDAAQGIAAEFGSTTAAGFFSLQAPAFSPASNRYGFISWGSSIGVGGQALDTSALRAAPTTNVLTGTGDIAADTAILRVNGTQVASSATDQGTGNYLAYPMYVGRRGGSSLPFNGRIYSLIVRFGANLTATQIAQTEGWVNGKTGAY